MPIICLMVRENHKMVREMSGKSQGILWGLMAGHPEVCSGSIRPIAQITQCTSLISHNVPFCNRNVHVCTFLLQNTEEPLWKGQECLTKVTKCGPFPCIILYKSCLFYPSWQATCFERPPSWVAFIEGFHCSALWDIWCIVRFVRLV